ncbi:MAG: helix-turn-helix domain-containing protein [Tetrasphaera sp.]
MTTVTSAHAFGRLVKETREARGLTQARLAELAGVGRQWLVGFESGDKRSAPLAMIFRVLGALGLEVTLAPPPPSPPPSPPVDLSAIIAAHTRSTDG